MRDKEEIQKAHDMIVAVLTDEVKLDFGDGERQGLTIAADALCWVLHHENNDFAKALADLESDIHKAGHKIEKIP